MRTSRLNGLLSALCALALAPAALPDEPLPAAGPAPSWIANPKSDDSVFLYRVGYAEGARDPASARQAAYENALAVIADEMLARAGVEEKLRPELAPYLAVNQAELVPGAVYTAPAKNGLACWVQVSWPLAEKKALLERIEPEKKKALERVAFARRVEARFAEARAACGRGEYEAACSNLAAVARDYGSLRAPAFGLEDVRLLLGDAQAGRRDFLEARREYEGILAMGAAEPVKAAAAQRLKALPKPPPAWPLRDRWSGSKVALLAVVQEKGGDPAPAAALSKALERELREGRLETVDLQGQVNAGEAAALFDRRVLKGLAGKARQQGAGVALVVRLTVDPARKGQTQDMMGVQMPVPDAEAAFLVVDVEGEKICHEGRFQEVTANRSEDRLADRLVALIIEKHLVPKCPALAASGRNQP